MRNYRPLVGHRFWFDFLPILGTPFNGRFEGEIMRIVPQQLWSASLQTSPESATKLHWMQNIELSQNDTTTTTLKWSVDGVRWDIPHERIAARVYRGYAHYLLHLLRHCLEIHPDQTG